MLILRGIKEQVKQISMKNFQQSTNRNTRLLIINVNAKNEFRLNCDDIDDLDYLIEKDSQ